MKNMMAAVLVLVLTAVSPGVAAEISALAAAAVQGPLVVLLESFKKDAGHSVTVQFDTVPNIGRRLAAGETADVVIATAAGVDQVIAGGKGVADTRLTIGRIGIGVSVSRGRRADVSTVEALKGSILQADTVLVSQGTSGVYIRKMLADMGILDQITPKIAEVPSGVALMERLGAAGKNEIGFTAISEGKRGEAAGGGTLVGPLPASIQNFTEYQAVVTTASREPAAARQFVRTLGSDAARQLLVENGWDVQEVRPAASGK